MTKIKEFTFPSTDGKTPLHAMAWLPAGREVKAVLQIAHGVAEHIARYDDFARFLNTHDIAVVGHDHLGHGLSLPDGAVPVYFGDGNTWETVVDDIHALHLYIRKAIPDVPLFLLGHSMGSFLARTYLIRYPGTLRGAIIMGTGWQSEPVLLGGLALAGTIVRRRGGSTTDPTVTRLAFGAYNKPFAPNRTDYDWLSADSANVDRYIADPHCGQEATVGLFRQMLRGIRFNQKSSHLRQMDPTLPVLFTSGAMDPVGDMSKGVQRSCEAFRRAGMQDVSLHLYPGLRHEILNESLQRGTVYGDLLGWLHAHM
jgi:alpha-beta hydrolase superfamily lysophospholipase